MLAYHVLPAGLMGLVAGALWALLGLAVWTLWGLADAAVVIIKNISNTVEIFIILILVTNVLGYFGILVGRFDYWKKDFVGGNKGLTFAIVSITG